MSACPDCGFDLPENGSCGVCAVALPLRDEGGGESRGKTGRALAFLLRFLLPGGLGLACLALGLIAYFELVPVRNFVASAADAPTFVGSAAPLAGNATPDQPAVANPARPIFVDISPKILHSANSLDPDPRLAAMEAPHELPVSKNNPPLDSKESFIAWMLANTKESEAQLAKKWDRSRAILARGEVRNKGVLEAFLYAPREFFARSYNAKKAYDDTAIPIGHGQTISGPHMVSHMTDSIAPLPGDRILEIGTGSGYQSALLAELSDQVYTIEIVPGLYAETDAIYRKLVKEYPEYAKVTRKNADGYYGWPEHAPFDKIIVTAGIDHIPPPLLAQLAPGGIMVIPVGPPSGQTVLKVVKKPLPGGGFSFERSDIYHGRKVIFVPFTSDKGKVHSLNDAAGVE
ncbi:MAG TPA: protein-L-isoaspartate(D-aspartate) O-methyltransferase [Rectinemataceae bacterium]|nr:protein-L-isoaspartate(D-aspartate) O-methyltransferase [Rectinemataceae bacterium]